MNKSTKLEYLPDDVLDAVSEVDEYELELEEEDIRKAVLSLPKDQQKQYKFLLK